VRLIYFSSVTWSSYAQRPHAMVRYFLEQGGEAVLWVEPYPTRLPAARDMSRREALHNQQTPLPAGVSLLNPGGLPIEPVPGGAWVNRRLFQGSALRRIKEFAANPVTVAVGRPSALAFYTLRELSPVASFYDAMDDFPEFYDGLSKASMARREAVIAGIVDKIYVPSQVLEAKYAYRKDAVVSLPNACHMSLLPPVYAKKDGHIVLGYIGAIGAWFDWNIVIELARAAPEAEIHLVGPCFSPSRFALPDNVQLHGPCRQDEIGEHLQRFSVGIIPFKNTHLTASVDPIKYYEYRGMGLPILSTSFGAMTQRGRSEGVFFIDHEKDLSAIVREALNWCPCLDEITEIRHKNDWNSRFASARLFNEMTSMPTRRLSPEFFSE
jgi:hypothetical protein